MTQANSKARLKRPAIALFLQLAVLLQVRCLRPEVPHCQAEHDEWPDDRCWYSQPVQTGHSTPLCYERLCNKNVRDDLLLTVSWCLSAQFGSEASWWVLNILRSRHEHDSQNDTKYLVTHNIENYLYCDFVALWLRYRIFTIVCSTFWGLCLALNGYETRKK